MTDHTAALTYSDALRIARGCTDYGGGYRGDAALFEAYQHGIQTVITALTHADPKDSQTRALMAMGAQPQQPAGWRQSDTSRLRELLEKATPGPWSAIGSAGYVQAGNGHPKHTILAVAYGHDGNHQINAPGSRENGEYIAACNPEAIRALLDELDVLRGAHPSQQEDDVRDAARLDWMFGQECFVESVLTEDGPAYRVHWPDDGSWQTELFTTPRYAIDAAMSGSAGEGGKNG